MTPITVKEFYDPATKLTIRKIWHEESLLPQEFHLLQGNQSKTITYCDNGTVESYKIVTGGHFQKFKWNEIGVLGPIETDDREVLSMNHRRLGFWKRRAYNKRIGKLESLAYQEAVAIHFEMMQEQPDKNIYAVYDRQNGSLSKALNQLKKLDGHLFFDKEVVAIQRPPERPIYPVTIDLSSFVHSR